METDIYFKDKTHKDRFLALISKLPERYQSDAEHISVMYLFSSSDAIYTHINDVFNFEARSIKLDGLNKGWQTGASVRMTRMAFNLWNNYSDEASTPLDLFSGLDSDNFRCMLQAMELRFGV